MSHTCPLCNSSDTSIHYRGIIRVGSFGANSTSTHEVARCNSCKVQWLLDGGEGHEYYTSGTYVEEFDSGSEFEEYFQIHDPIQLRHLNWIGVDSFRGKKIADVGCGGGSFLDFTKNIASETIGVDLNPVFVERLNSVGHKGYSSIDAAAKDFKSSVDIITSFSVIEHVEHPIDYLSKIKEMATPETRLFISTPNANEFLLNYDSEAYKRFFYRKVHLWYFNEQSLTNLLDTCGWKVTKTHFHQRFGLSNFINWIQQESPKANAELPFVTETMSNCWRAELSAQRISDYFCVEASLK